MKKVSRFDLNKVGRDFVVGDIHGMYTAFMSFLNSVNFDKSIDRVFSVGDLIDRGENSVNAIGLMYEPWFHVCMANHEDMMCQGLLNNDLNQLDSWMYNGGREWSREQSTQLLNTLAKDFMDKASMIMVVDTPSGRVNILHAELYLNADRNPVTDEDIDNWNFNDVNEVMMVWGRTIWESRAHFPKVYKGLSTTYVGHIYGNDPKILYLRGEFEAPHAINRWNNQYNTTDFPNIYSNIPSTSNNMYYTSYFGVFICGKYYMMKKVVSYCGEAVAYTIVKNGGEPNAPRRFWQLTNSYKRGVEYKIAHKLHKETKQPVLEFDYGAGGLCVSNLVPKLGELGFASIIPAETLYQDIEWYFANVIYHGVDINPPVTISDTDRITQHGFDLKQSFRHRK